jgi:hypothetical protein
MTWSRYDLEIVSFTTFVMAGLVPAIPVMEAPCLVDRDRRDEPGDDGFGCVDLLKRVPSSFHSALMLASRMMRP